MTDFIDELAFHEGELTAQRRAGVSEEAERIRPIIARTVPIGAVGFLAQQRMVVLGSSDDGGRAWATSLHGPAGFLSAADPHTLRVVADALPTDPLADVLRHEADVGTLVIDLASRRRLRVNGRWRRVDGAGEIEVHQAFGNCPKYIQSRSVGDVRARDRGMVASRKAELDHRDTRLVSTADTFFIATSAHRGADVSHRGGNPGFVRVLSSTELSWPDYVGNTMMMTSGNLQVNPSAGLLFPDWESGATLQLTGTARVRRSSTMAAQRPATEWETIFELTEAVWIQDAFPAGWSQPVHSRFNGA